jgi:hypothetical protein
MDPALKALREAVAEAIAMHFRMGHPIAIWKNGRVVWRHPDGRETPDRPVWKRAR